MIGASNMTAALRAKIAETMPQGEPPADATAQVWALMRRKSSYEMLAIREACLALRAAMAAIASAKRAGAGVTAAVWRERSRPMTPARRTCARCSASMAAARCSHSPALISQDVDPLQVYVAVRRFNYWAEGFSLDVGAQADYRARKAAEHAAICARTIKAETRAADVAQMIAAAMRPYRRHPVTERSFATNAIGLALDEPPYTDVDVFEPGEIYSMKVGVTDAAENNAIVSAMIRVRDDGNEVLWST